MDSSIIQFIVNSIFPWLVFSSLVYASFSYKNKLNNISPNIWWFALVSCFLPFIPLSLSSMNIAVLDLEYIGSSLESVKIVKQASITQVSLREPDLAAAVLIIGYIFVTCSKLVRLVTVWQKLKRISSSSEIIGSLSDNGTQVVVSSLNHSPFVFGISVPQIVLPKYFRSLEKEQQSILLQHELTHIANKDHVAILIWRVLSTLLWINPFIKKMEWQFIQAMEHRCDRLTIYRFNVNRYSYANTLLQSLKRSIHLNNSDPVAQFNSGALCPNGYKSRLTNIVRPANKSSLRLAVKFSLMIFALFSLYALVKEAAVTEKVTWQHPIENHTVSSSFRSISNIRHYKPHQGVDYVAKSGSSVLSAADGIIIVADNRTLHPNYGNTVLVQHKGGYQTLYSHLESIEAKTGTWVKAGQNIGVIGDTGKTTGLHLHFEVIKDNQRIDPSLIFNTEALRR